MARDHICSDSCFNARKSAAKTVIKCLRCDRSFSTKCFGLQSAVFNLILSDESNVVFLCAKCHDKVSKVQHNLRLSSNFKGNTAPSIDKSPIEKRASTSIQNQDEATVSSENHSTSFMPKILHLFDTIN